MSGGAPCTSMNLYSSSSASMCFSGSPLSASLAPVRRTFLGSVQARETRSGQSYGSLGAGEQIRSTQALKPTH